MKITTFCFCIIGTMLGVWLADLGAWASAGGIWVICIILAIDGAARARATKEEPERQRTLSTPGGLGRIQESDWPPRPFYKPGYTPPPPPKKPANPFKIGNKALVFGKHEGTIIGIAGQSVKIISDDDKVVWVPSKECELICEKQF